MDANIYAMSLSTLMTVKMHKIETLRVYPRVHYFQRRYGDLLPRFKRLINAFPKSFHVEKAIQEIDDLHEKFTKKLEVCVIGHSELDFANIVVSTKPFEVEKFSDLKEPPSTFLFMCYTKTDQLDQAGLKVFMMDSIFYSHIPGLPKKVKWPVKLVCSDTVTVYCRCDNTYFSVKVESLEKFPDERIYERGLALLKKKPKSLAAFKEDVQWATGEQRFISDSGEKNPHHYATDSECPHDPIDQDEDPQDMHYHVDDSGDQQSLMSDNNSPHNPVNHHEDVDYMYDNEAANTDYKHDNLADTGSPHDPIDQHEEQVYTGDNVLDSDRQLEPADQHKSPQDMHDHLDDSGDQQSLMSDNNSPHNPVNHHEDVDYMYDNEAANTDYIHDNLADTGSPHDPIDQHEEQVYTGDNVLDSDRQLEPADQHKSPQDMHDHLDDSGALSKSIVTWPYYKQLCKYAQTRLMSYNNRQSVEVENVTVKNYMNKLQMDDIDEGLIGEITPLERYLMETHDLIQVRGKKSSVVPMLIPPECTSVINFLADREVRSRVGINPKNDYLFPNKDNASTVQDNAATNEDNLHADQSATGIFEVEPTAVETEPLDDEEDAVSVVESDVSVEEVTSKKSSICKKLSMKKRQKWTIEEEKEIRKYFQKNLERKITPGKVECVKVKQLSLKAGGELHKRYWHLIVKKVSAMIRK